MSDAVIIALIAQAVIASIQIITLIANRRKARADSLVGEATATNFIKDSALDLLKPYKDEVGRLRDIVESQSVQLAEIPVLKEIIKKQSAQIAELRSLQHMVESQKRTIDSLVKLSESQQLEIETLQQQAQASQLRIDELEAANETVIRENVALKKENGTLRKQQVPPGRLP